MKIFVGYIYNDHKTGIIPVTMATTYEKVVEGLNGYSNKDFSPYIKEYDLTQKNPITFDLFNVSSNDEINCHIL